MMTPGQYIQKRREAAGCTIQDLALCLDTVPAVSASVRVDWLKQIEADLVPVPDGLIEALRELDIVALDADVLNDLIDTYTRRDTWSRDPICRSCGCSEYDACKPECSWAEPDLCSNCVPVPAASGPALVIANRAITA